MVFSNDIHMIKPHKDIFHYLLKKYKLNAETCLFVDDMKRNIRTAELAMMNAVHYTNIIDLKKRIS
jgi:putative hydrolase of the HAD superfamily